MANETEVGFSGYSWKGRFAVADDGTYWVFDVLVDKSGVEYEIAECVIDEYPLHGDVAGIVVKHPDRDEWATLALADFHGVTLN